MDLRPIVSTLRRHKIAAGLIVLEVALTCTIVTNALHLIETRVEALNTDSGLVEAEIAVLNLRGSKPQPPERTAGIVAEDLAQLRALPGIKSATVANQIVYGNNSNNTSVAAEPDNKNQRISAAQYVADEHMLPAFGLKLLEGRNFTATEVQEEFKVMSTANPRIGQVIINKVLADKLFPGQSAVGRTLYLYGDSPSTIIGVVQTLTHTQLHRARQDSGGAALILPMRGGGSYIIRAEPGELDARIKAATAALEAGDQGRVVTQALPLTEMRATFYAQDRAMAWLMGGVCLALLLVTAMGIVGLASFWVQQRTRMIGTRRALGATQGQILRYFQVENLLLTTLGVVLGLAGALGLSHLLMQSYALPRLPWGYLPAGAVSLAMLGQVAVWAPARRAARLPPVAALRS
ncbi:ABC transporter permease [Roseateles cellulosilyticus]|uniref:ABC transporter permease n=1 Tax=Pelomonas cellulosilytica TaxID=2906762 RepID=A0ABS8XN62_9BURK|nr:FtsX-like permease family protein [Pelomonas sp. P8]MCE4554214.1 ABC transporter permease [Pelomonas sp. P8]